MGVETSQHYTGAAGVRYAAKRYSDVDRPVYDLNFRVFRPYINPGDRVLDFGCGNGGLLVRIRDHGADAEGLEVNAAAAAVAEGLGLHVYRQLEEVPAARYDVIVSNHVLEHVRDPSSTLEKLRAKLRPGGRLVMKLPIDDIRARRQRAWDREDIDHHLHTWTPRLIANTMFEAGFEVESCRVYAHALHDKLLPFHRTPLGPAVFKLFATVMHRRQLVAVGVNSRTPSES
ncbi:MAG: class I SAM-dependent methyltransferase [Phycisphaerales bacterium JB039]